MRKGCAFSPLPAVGSVLRVEWGAGAATAILLACGWQWLKTVEERMGETWSCCLAHREAHFSGDLNYLQFYGLPLHFTPTSFTGSPPWLHIAISHWCPLGPTFRDSDSNDLGCSLAWDCQKLLRLFLRATRAEKGCFNSKPSLLPPLSFLFLSHSVSSLSY